MNQFWISPQEILPTALPTRICTVHARLITQEDQVLLYAEVKRVVKAITKS
jgi:hypothetical protein